MSDAKLILLGGAAGLVAFALWRYFSRDSSHDPVVLPAGAVYGPAVPVPGETYVPGFITEGLQ